ncbi:MULTISPECIES: hypothetical protein [Chryseobacterium]|uniref:Lipoprotein n=1 Tax=Chryseobacterium oryzae TaxID=2929799 RepID=A0ABY4BGY7_9FLAO|nr:MULTISPECIES: hypothetical protein [Chryseobacterium]UOE38436.1 hypothetical protein MTP08_01265 [Chryseobacterium oryzae]
MKKSLFVAAIAAISLVACKKGDATETKTDSLKVEGDSTLNAIDSTKTAAVDSIKTNANAAVDSVKTEAKNAKEEVKTEVKNEVKKEEVKK